MQLTNPDLPHQIVLFIGKGSHKISVSCNCLATRTRQGPRRHEVIEQRTVFPASEALATYHAWHAERSIALAS